MTLWLVPLGVALVVFLVTILRQRRRPVVLGAQVAAAAVRERQHRARVGDRPSPLPAGDYDPRESLLDPVVNDVDRELRAACRGFAAADDRDHVRDASTADDFYKLVYFIRRASLFALRERDRTWLEDGLTAAAMIDADRIDERDLWWALGFLHYAARRLAIDPIPLFEAAAPLATPAVATLLRKFPRRDDLQSNPPALWGFREVETPNGPGLVESGDEHFAPSRDFLAIGQALREVLRADRYEAEIQLAETLPEVWFPAGARKEAAALLRQSRATALVRATLRDELTAFMSDRGLLIFFTEAASEEGAAALLRLAHRDAESASVATQNGPLFLLGVATSWLAELAPSETAESMKRFEARFAAALAENSAVAQP